MQKIFTLFINVETVGFEPTCRIYSITVLQV